MDSEREEKTQLRQVIGQHVVGIMRRTRRRCYVSSSIDVFSMTKRSRCNPVT
jgi:hypothetical protein